MGRDPHSRRRLSQNVALFSLDLLGDGRLSFFEQGLVSNVLHTSNHISTKTVPHGIRTHVAYVKSHASGSKFYINGHVANTFGPDILSADYFMTQSVCLGADCALLNRYYVGTMDNLNVYNGSLSPSQIAEIVNSTARKWLWIVRAYTCIDRPSHESCMFRTVCCISSHRSSYLPSYSIPDVYSRMFEVQHSSYDWDYYLEPHPSPLLCILLCLLDASSKRILMNDKFGDGWNLARLVVYASTGFHRAYELGCGENTRLEHFCFTPEQNTDGDFVILSIVGFRASHFWDVRTSYMSRCSCNLFCV